MHAVQDTPTSSNCYYDSNRLCIPTKNGSVSGVLLCKRNMCGDTKSSFRDPNTDFVFIN
jgi:hypothetical protein